jgi:sodium pump decarboxylase gamma subunit
MNNFSDTMVYTLIVTLFGMGIVFIVLVLLQYVLEGMRVIFYKDKDEQGKAVKLVEVKAPAAVAVQPVEAPAYEEDEELIAVITAAIASSLGGRSSIVVRNIRRVDDMTPAWAKTGRNEQMASRF